MRLVLFDTNILIDALSGYEAAIAELTYWDAPAISAITWMEIYAGAGTEDSSRFDAFMLRFGFEILPINEQVMQRAARLRAARRLRGPKIALEDAVIQATADVNGLTVVTRNKKDFKGRYVRIPYELETTVTVATINISPPASARIYTRPAAAN